VRRIDDGRSTIDDLEGAADRCAAFDHRSTFINHRFSGLDLMATLLAGTAAGGASAVVGFLDFATWFGHGSSFEVNGFRYGKTGKLGRLGFAVVRLPLAERAGRDHAVYQLLPPAGSRSNARRQALHLLVNGDSGAHSRFNSDGKTLATFYSN
jgi:hypothetical protein